MGGFKCLVRLGTSNKAVGLCTAQCGIVSMMSIMRNVQCILINIRPGQVVENMFDNTYEMVKEST